MTAIPSAPAPVSPSNLPPVPSSGAPIWVTVVIGLGCLGLGLSISLLARGGQTAPLPVVASTSGSVSAPVAPPPDKLTLAAQGERQAMDELSAIAVEQRTVAQAMALSKGRAAEKQMALEHLRETLTKEVKPEELKKLMLFAQDGDTARGAIGIAAGLMDEKGCDLLYELQTLKSTPPEMAMLAGHFLSSKDVRGKASAALTLVLDLKDATTCEQRKAVLEKAIQVGDKRLVRHIVPLTKKTGCGDKKNDDCHPCLREENQKIIREALTKTQARKSPTF